MADVDSILMSAQVVVAAVVDGIFMSGQLVVAAGDCKGREHKIQT